MSLGSWAVLVVSSTVLYCTIVFTLTNELLEIHLTKTAHSPEALVKFMLILVFISSPESEYLPKSIYIDSIPWYIYKASPKSSQRYPQTIFG